MNCFEYWLTFHKGSLSDHYYLYCFLLIVNYSNKFASFTNNISLWSYGWKFDEIIKKLELDVVDIYDWLQSNPRNFFDISSSIWNKKLWKNNSRKRPTNSEDLFGVPIDSNVTFNEHVTKLGPTAHKRPPNISWFS